MDSSMQYKVLEFDMPAEDFDPNFTPEDGIQFLQRMAWERQRCPAVVSVPLAGNGNGTAMPTPAWSPLKPNSADAAADDKQPKPAAAAAATATDLPDTHRPTAEWKRIQLAEFAQLRAQIDQLRPQFARRPNATNIGDLPDVSDARAWRLFMQAERPLLSTMLRLDQQALEQVLEHQLEWLLLGDAADDQDEEMEGDEAVENEAERAAAVRCSWDLEALAALGRWIYSLMGCLLEPVEPQVHSTLRALAQAALEVRNGLAEDEEGAQRAAPLNLLVVIVALCFGQADLAERV